jgi:hypothetical protein
MFMEQDPQIPESRDGHERGRDRVDGHERSRDMRQNESVSISASIQPGKRIINPLSIVLSSRSSSFLDAYLHGTSGGR